MSAPRPRVLAPSWMRYLEGGFARNRDIGQRSGRSQAQAKWLHARRCALYGEKYEEGAR